MERYHPLKSVFGGLGTIPSTTDFWRIYSLSVEILCFFRVFSTWCAVALKYILKEKKTMATITERENGTYIFESTAERTDAASKFSRAKPSGLQKGIFPITS